MQQTDINKAIINFNSQNYLESLDILKSIKIDDQNKNIILTYIALNQIFLKKYQEAITNLLTLKDLKENRLLNYKNLAFCYLSLNQIQNAISTYHEAIKLFPSEEDLFINLAYIYRNSGKIHDAVNILSSKYDLFANSINFLNSLSSSYFEINEIDKTINLSTQALKKDSNNFQALINLGNSYQKLENFEKALEYFERSISNSPNSALAYCNRGVVYFEMLKYDLALNDFNKSINLDKNYSNAYLYKSIIELSLNKFDVGWNNYEHRWSKQKKRINSNLPKWEGNPFDINILIYGEQSFGEEMLFCTQLHDIQKKFNKIYLIIEKRLIPIYRENFPNIIFLNEDDNLGEFKIDYQVSLFSLARYFRNSTNDFLNFTPLKLKKRKFNKSKINCGISWKSLGQLYGKRRSINLSQMIKILEINEIEFYNLQYSNEIYEITELKENYKINFIDTPDIDKFNDLYSLSQFISGLDFVITISNATAHLSGALNIPTLLILPKNIGNVWYWNNQINNESLWYPSVKIFRQSIDGEWDSVIEKLKNYICKNFI